MKKKLFILISILIISISVIFVIKKIDKKRKIDIIFEQYENLESDKIKFFTFIDDSIKKSYPGLNMKENKYGFKWDEISNYYETKIKKTKNDDEYIFLLKEMLSIFDDPHTDVINHRRLKVDKSLPLGLQKSEDNFFIYGYNNDATQNIDKIDFGDQLLKIDGISINNLYNKLSQKTVYKYIENEEELLTKRFFRTYYYNFKRFSNNNKFSRLTFKDKMGKQYSINLEWKATSIYQNMYGVKYKPVLENVGIQWNIIENSNIGYIKIDSWNPNNKEEFNKAFDELNKTDALILDVRNNFGGDFSSYGQLVLSKFITDQKTTIYKKFINSKLYHLYGINRPHYQESNSFKNDFFEKVPVICNGRDSKYDKPVFLLVNENHFSSNDLFIIAFKELNIGKIVGRINNFKLLGQPIRIKSPWFEWRLSLSTMIPYSRNNQLYEDKKIKLDVLVPIKESKIFNDKDNILDKTLNIIKKSGINN